MKSEKNNDKLERKRTLEKTSLLGPADDEFENSNFIFSSENFLLDDLFGIFCNYYGISKNILITDKNHGRAKISMMEKKNELFKLLCIFTLYAPKFKLNVSLDSNFYLNSKLNNNYLSATSKCHKDDKIKIALTQGIIFELLSTESINDYGLLLNLKFKYLTNINLKNKGKKNYIKNALFFKVKEKVEHEKKNKVKYEDDDNFGDNEIKIICKERDEIFDVLESHFDSNDNYNLVTLQSAFKSFLINVYYKYLNIIISEGECSKDDK